MDVDKQSLCQLLFGDKTESIFDSDVIESEEFQDYLDYMCCSGVDNLLRQKECFEEEKQVILKDTKKLASENYKTFIKSSECVSDINDKFGEIDIKLQNLTGQLPTFNRSFQSFNGEVGEILNRKRQNNQTLVKHNQLLETLEVTQLMDTCVRNHYYDEGLELCSFVRRLEKRLEHVPLIKSIASDVEKLKQVMLQQLFQQLKGNVQLPVCLKLIGYLRRMELYREDQLRMKFLQARGSWLRNIIKSVPKTDPYTHITKVIELNRVHLFDVVTQYRALFANEEQVFIVNVSSTNLRNIFNSWILSRVSEFLLMLREDLKAGAISRIESVLNQAMYFGLSFSRIGADFRMLMLPIFNEVIVGNFEDKLDQVLASFKSILACYTFTGTSISANTIVQLIAQPGTINPPSDLVLYPPLSWTVNEVIAVLNELRNCCPVACENQIIEAMDSFVSMYANVLSDYYANEKSTMTHKEIETFVKTCKALKESLAPFLLKAPRKIFRSNEIVSDETLGVESKLAVINPIINGN
ncbi:conserved oligomeric Golgi complex subunit 8-like [Symsagittifera roscoffensis]|uniref:conserved oligomeric Golgi complex subunit 8-like n=1 Tax=Symsagittifera roscoffensis TaxID=84072 RepID=UPI00307B35F8